MPLSYTDALRLLGADEGPVLAAVKRLGTVAAVAGAVGGVDLFALRDEIVSTGGGALRTLRDRLTGISRFDRTQRLVAAHGVLVISSFYAALGEGADWLHPDAAEQVAVAAGATPPASYRAFVAALSELDAPMPSGTRSFERALEDLRGYYRQLAEQVARFAGGLSPSAAGDRLIGLLADLPEELAARAVRQYETGYRALAVDVPEFRVWAAMLDGQATRGLVREGLADLTDLLVGMSPGLAAGDRRAELARRYRARLDKPIVDPDGLPAEVALPTLAAQYVDPRCRVATTGAASGAATESWWAGRPLVDDIAAFFAGHLTSPVATEVPLVILGQPGAGKSALTSILAARLPETDFFPVRVALRGVPADASVQTQIEEAVYQETGERTGWPSLARAAGDALPVVLLDGFDELLQATGMNRADYLEHVRDFQQREAELGRPVAVIVTSRTVVADRTRFPRGTVAVKLEPFDEREVARWLAVWNATNGPSLAARGLRPLPADAVLSVPHLAGQPLLLLLLALYDADGNRLQRAGAALGEAELYGRLLADFAGREVRKHSPELPPSPTEDAVEAEIRRLAVVALAMFNRGRQVVTETELDRDLPAMLGDDLPTVVDGGRGAARPLTAAQVLIGRFFFIHESQASRDTGVVEKSYEFLHATFGEYLVARYVIATVRELAEERRFHAARHRPFTLDGGPLWAALSFAVLAGRSTIARFCGTLLAELADEERRSCLELLVALLRDAERAHPTWSRASYEPAPLGVPARCAAYSANLVLLIVLAASRPLGPRDLFGNGGTAADWRRHGSLWQSQLSPADWAGLVAEIRVWWTVERRPVSRHTWSVTEQMWVGREDGSDISLYAALPSFAVEIDNADIGSSPAFPDTVRAASSRTAFRFREAAVAGVSATDGYGQLLHGVSGLWRAVRDAGRPIEADGVVATDLRALIELRMNPVKAGGEERRVRLYRSVLGVSPWATSSMVLRQLREDVHDGLPREAVLDLLLDVPVETSTAFLLLLDVLAAVARRDGDASRLPRAHLRLAIARGEHSYGNPAQVREAIGAAFARVGLDAPPLPGEPPR